MEDTIPPDHPIDPAADRFFPYGPHGAGHGVEPDGLRLGFNRHYPPPGHFSPDALRRECELEEQFGRGVPYYFWHPLDGHGGPPRPQFSLKRKFGEEEGRDGREQQLLQYGNLKPNGFQGGDRPGSPPRWNRAGGRWMNCIPRSTWGVGYRDPLPSRRGGRVLGGAEVKYVDVDLSDLKKAFLHWCLIYSGFLPCHVIFFSFSLVTHPV